MRLLVLFVFCRLLMPAQADSLPLLSPSGISDRLFLNFGDFRNNRPVLKEDLVSAEDKEQVDFISRACLSDQLFFMRGQKQDSVSTDSVWGFFQNNTFYINFGGKFRRAPVFGSICYFVLVEKDGKIALNNTVGAYPRVSPLGVASSAAAGAITTVDKICEFLLNCNTNEIMEYSVENVAWLLSNDRRLSYRFGELSKKERRQMARGFIREYNDLHPVYYKKTDQ